MSALTKIRSKKEKKNELAADFAKLSFSGKKMVKHIEYYKEVVRSTENNSAISRMCRRK